MTPDNEIVNGLWIGSKLSRIELLTIRSFLAKGHRFRLWLYGPLSTPLPAGTEVCDASEIIPADRVFSYRQHNKYGHGKGSVAGFSDIFRYKLLYDHGGWWVDMDVTCLQPLDIDTPYFFRDHHELQVVGNVMKCPRHSAVMLQCYEEASATVDEHNTDWHKPIEILNKGVREHGLSSYICTAVSNPDQWDKTVRYVRYGDTPPQHWLFIHWQNEEWRSRNISKADFRLGSTLALLMEEYGLYMPPQTAVGRLANRIRHFRYF